MVNGQSDRDLSTAGDIELESVELILSATRLQFVTV